MSALPNVSPQSVSASSSAQPLAHTTRDWILWLCCFAYAMHVIEEVEFNWVAWAQGFGIHVKGWDSFYVNNVGVILFGAGAAVVAWRAPWVSLAYSALMLVNALCFHLLPTVLTGRVNPGFLTAMVLFLPLGLATFSSARRDGVLSARSLVGAFTMAIVVQGFPLVLIALRPLLTY